jgi:dihydrofolate reductase
MPKISIIVAIANKNAIGQNNDLLTYIPNDLKRFKELTTGHPIIMGRKTFDSLPKGALPNRRNIVISRNEQLVINGVEVVHSPEEALKLCTDEPEVFIIGGATIYKAFLPKADKLYLTLIDKTFDNADTFFPEINEVDWKETYREEVINDEKADVNYTFVNLRKV